MKNQVGLTERQTEVLNFIKAYAKAHGGVTPSYDEITEACNLGVKSNAHRYITTLEERGYITRLPNKSRSIAVCSPINRSMKLVQKIQSIKLVAAELERIGHLPVIKSSDVLAWGATLKSNIETLEESILGQEAIDHTPWSFVGKN